MKRIVVEESKVSKYRSNRAAFRIPMVQNKFKSCTQEKAQVHSQLGIGLTDQKQVLMSPKTMHIYRVPTGRKCPQISALDDL